MCIEFCCVPGHVGVPGNERADKLVREASIRVTFPSPVPFTDVLPTILDAIIAIWQERWNVCGVTSKISSLELY